MAGRFRFWNFDTRVHYRSDFVEQMSATDIKNAGECDFKVYYKLLGEFKPPKSIPLVLGSIFHEVIEQDLRYKVKRGVNMKWEEVNNYFENVWVKAKQGCAFDGKITEEQAKIKCKTYIRIYHLKMSPMLYPLDNSSIEKFFRVYITFGDKRLGITGKVDMIGKDMFITDHKTSSAVWTQKDADEEIQAQLYSYCMKNLGFEIQGFKFSVVSGVGVNVFPVEYNQAKLKEILLKAFDIKKRLEGGQELMLRSRSERICKFCDFGRAGICKESLFKKEEVL